MTYMEDKLRSGRRWENNIKTNVKEIDWEGVGWINLLQPIGYVMNQQFNIQQLYILPTLCLCVLYLSQNKQRLLPHTTCLIGFYNRDEKCLLRGTNWVFK